MEGLLLLGPNVNSMQLLLRFFNEVKELNILSIAEQLYTHGLHQRKVLHVH